MQATPPPRPTADLLAGVPGVALRRATDRPVTDLTDDSRAVRDGALFIARGEWSDKTAQHVADAVARGAAAVLTDANAPDDAVPDHVALAVAETVDQTLAGAVADAWFDHPGDRLRLVGVTGTNGKTTIAILCQSLLNASELPAGLIGTVVTDTGDPAGPVPAELTTPGAIELRRLLFAMVQHGRRAAVMEVSSHALDQGRVAGLAFDAAVFTNLTQDHLDYHGTMERYAEAKAALFAMLKPTGWAVINADDPYGPSMAQRAASGRVLWTTLHDDGVAPGEHACRCVPVTLRADASVGRFAGPWGDFEATLPLPGRHNLSNALQAAAAAHTVVQQKGRSLRQRLEACPPVPGRLEPVRRADGRGPAVLVDYAHTPDALANVTAALRPVTPGRLIVVFGCGGDRDRAKRPRMAEQACKLADAVVITSDNPRREDPDAIIADALAGVPPRKRSVTTTRADRAAAIADAIAHAAEGDTVLIAGKGHEDYQVIADPPGVFGKQTKKIHFDDREHAAAALQRWHPLEAAC